MNEEWLVTSSVLASSSGHWKTLHSHIGRPASRSAPYVSAAVKAISGTTVSTANGRTPSPGIPTNTWLGR